MSVVLTRIDDRLIHGQVVIGWVQSLRAKRIALVDDEIRAEQWQQELYAIGVPQGLAVEFVSVDEAVRSMERWVADPVPTIVLIANVDATARLLQHTDAIKRINVGGIHDTDGRYQRLDYLYLSEHEAELLHRLHEGGVEITAQDVPTARPVPLEEWG